MYLYWVLTGNDFKRVLIAIEFSRKPLLTQEGNSAA